VERSGLRGLSYGKEKAELLHVVCVLRQAGWSEAIYAACPTWLSCGEKGCGEFLREEIF
jgi:hypothetical protein